GHSSFLVNLVNLGLVASVGERLLFEVSLNFEPRQGNLGSPGDLVDVDLAYLQWRPWQEIDLSFYLGKLESTFGIEYRRRKAPDLRFELRDFVLRAEYLESHADGGGVLEVPWLRAQGAYVELAYQFLSWLGGYARADWRKARLYVDPNLYVSNVERLSAALRF